MDIFYLYQPKIIIATHSPLIVSGAELFAENANVFKAENFVLELQNKDPLNVEELYFTFFDISTPENRFLSQRVIRLLNMLAEYKISIQRFNEEINRYKTMSFEEKQMETLNGIQAIAQEIVSRNN